MLYQHKTEAGAMGNIVHRRRGPLRGRGVRAAYAAITTEGWFYITL